MYIEGSICIKIRTSDFLVTDAEYFKSLGYYISEGIIEDKTMFLKRMTGLARFYAAITISRLPGQEAQTKNHPHGLAMLWRLIGEFVILFSKVHIF